MSAAFENWWRSLEPPLVFQLNAIFSKLCEDLHRVSPGTRTPPDVKDFCCCLNPEQRGFFTALGFVDNFQPLIDKPQVLRRFCTGTCFEPIFNTQIRQINSPLFQPSYPSQPLQPSFSPFLQQSNPPPSAPPPFYSQQPQTATSVSSPTQPQPTFGVGTSPQPHTSPPPYPLYQPAQHPTIFIPPDEDEDEDEDEDCEEEQSPHRSFDSEDSPSNPSAPQQQGQRHWFLSEDSDIDFDADDIITISSSEGPDSPNPSQNIPPQLHCSGENNSQRRHTSASSSPFIRSRGSSHPHPQRRDERQRQPPIPHEPQRRLSTTHSSSYSFSSSSSPFSSSHPSGVGFSFTSHSSRPSPSPSRPNYVQREAIPSRPLRRVNLPEPPESDMRRIDRILLMERDLERMRHLSGRDGDDYDRLLDRFPIITRGTPSERVAMFPRWNYEPPKAGSEASRNEERTKCSICLEDFSRGDKVLSLPCFHIYHEDCIVHWLVDHKTCPICRKDCTEDERIE